MKKEIIVLFFFSLILSAQVKVGDNMPAFTLLNASNQKISGVNFNNKFILIDFWASWCAPCRLGNRKLVKLYNSINKDKMEIIGISIDNDKSKWLKAIEKDQIKYTQLIDPKGFDAKTAVLFGVEELPSKFLFNDKGILIAINPTEEQTINYLK